MCKMTPIGVRLNLKNFMLISCGVKELLSLPGGGILPPPGEIGLKQILYILRETLFLLR